MKPIEEQIETIIEELRPVPLDDFWYIDYDGYICASGGLDHKLNAHAWLHSLYSSTNKTEVEEYADCYRRLKLYQLLGKKAEKEFPFTFDICTPEKYGTDFGQFDLIHNDLEDYLGQAACIIGPPCVLGGVWFAREEDRLEAVKICGIDAEFQKRCAKHRLGGA